MAKANPDVFQPDVAESLNDLALLHIDLRQAASAEREIEEAIAINRGFWLKNPAVFGDPLARNLIVYVKVLALGSPEQSKLCSLIRESASVAEDSKLKEFAQSLLESCISQ